MARRFSSFVIFAGMRTGSNFLEECLKQFPGICSYGEAFNPHFIGHAKQSRMLDISLQERETNPVSLIEKMKSDTDGIPGFRYFHDHDPRIFDHCMKDEDCAKIILYRNPVESFVSHEIARKTNQWRLGDMQHAKSAKISFSRSRFEKHLADRQEFYLKVQHGLQTLGQSAFYIGYEDISDPNIVAGLARYLGVHSDIKKLFAKTKKQNPAPLKDKVENYSEMVSTLANSDYFALSGIPSFEPRRPPAIPSFVASASAPLIFMPIKSGPNENIVQWLAAFGKDKELVTEFSQKSLRQWKRKFKGHQSFAVVSHPVQRLYRAFITHFVLPGPDSYIQIKEVLVEKYGLPASLPNGDGIHDIEEHRFAFLKFAEFVKGNLNGQTSVRVDSAWASQSEVLKGMSGFMFPDHVLRENDLVQGLGYLASLVGRDCPELLAVPEHSPIPLCKLYNAEVEVAVRAAYQRDYMMFGFGPWQGTND